jgi:hypothetical protein
MVGCGDALFRHAGFEPAQEPFGDAHGSNPFVSSRTIHDPPVAQRRHSAECSTGHASEFQHPDRVIQELCRMASPSLQTVFSV